MALYINRRAPQSGLASVLATRGRMGDTELVHMTKPEVQRLMNTGLMSLNPQTGLPEYFFGDIFKGIKNFAKNIFKPQNLIPMVASIALPMVAGPLFATGGLLGSVGGFLGSAGTNALLSGLGTFGGKMLTGSDFDDAAYAGLTGAALRYGSGKLGQMLGPGDEAVRSNLQSSLGGGVNQGAYREALGQAARQNIGQAQLDVGFGEGLQEFGGDFGEMSLLESISPGETFGPMGVPPQAIGIDIAPRVRPDFGAVDLGSFQGPTVANLQGNLNDTALYGLGIDQNYSPLGYTDASAPQLEDVFKKNILNQQNLAAQNRAMGKALMQGKVTPQAAGLKSLTPAELTSGAEKLKARIVANDPYKLTRLSDKAYAGELTDDQAFKAALAQATPTGGDIKLVTDEAISLSRDPYTPFRESIGWKGDLSMPTAGFNMETAKNVAASLPLDTMLSSGLTSAEASMYVDEQAAFERQQEEAYKQYEESIKAKGGTPISLTQFKRQRQALNQPLNRADAIRAATQGGGYQYYGPTSYTPLGAHSVSPLNQLARASGGLISLGHGGRPDFEGMVQGRGHGMEDNVIMDIKEKGGLLAVSPKEYVVPADVMAMLGNGNPDDGAEEMDSFISKFRQKKYGRDRQPPEMDGGKALQSLMKG